MERLLPACAHGSVTSDWESMTAFPGTLANRAAVCPRSLRQRRGERGHVHPGQPAERGHPAQLHQHLQRRRLRLSLRDPGRPRPVQRRHHIKPEHRGTPAEEGRGPGTAARQLMVLKQGGVSLPARPPDLGGTGRALGFSVDHLFITSFWWVRCFWKHFLCDKRTGTLGVRCKNPRFCIMWLIYCCDVLICCRPKCAVPTLSVQFFLCLYDEARNRGAALCCRSLWILHILRNDGFTLVEFPQVALGTGSFSDVGSSTVTVTNERLRRNFSVDSSCRCYTVWML